MPGGFAVPVDPDKRKLRELKRAVKKRGNKARRAGLKRGLAADPEGAADAEGSVGRYTSEAYNGLDHDSKRKPAPPEGAPELSGG